MNLRRILLLVFIVALAVTASQKLKPQNMNLSSVEPARPIHADWMIFQDTDSLISTSDIIVNGDIIKIEDSVKVPVNFVFPDKVTKEQRDAIINSPEGYVIYTVSQVKINEVIKGQFKPGDIIQVYQLGGVAIPESKTKYYKKGEKYILFLNKFSDDLKDKDKFAVKTPIQGDIEIVTGKTKVNKDNKLFNNDVPEKDFNAQLKGKVR